MMVVDCLTVNSGNGAVTDLVLDECIPNTFVKTIFVDNTYYDCSIIYPSPIPLDGIRTIAVQGEHDFKGKEIELI